MGNGLIAFLFALGAAAWIGNKFYGRTGGNTQKSLGAAAITGVLAFLIMLTILWQIS